MIGDIQGVSMGGKIKLSPDAGTKTLIHEIAHELLHQAEKSQMSREEKEMEAEAVAYIVSKFFKINNLSSANYLSLYGFSSVSIQESFGRITQCASEIIRQILREDITGCNVDNYIDISVNMEKGF